ncbi:bifunctional glutamate N-acetyltransferase/amino-acid acetyltransferase ArgJ [Massilia sp. W12]|uniref:bifunctional glutamate N-acetyltransferase/amino-acid acetyltransferase ArgJ n=1 Tax=Massilia sp. W12 TaxID=3126507 RepID=UPI0030D1CF3E
MSSDAFAQIRISEPADGDPAQTRYAFHSVTEQREIELAPDLSQQPSGLRSAAVMAGIKYPGVYDMTLVALDAPGPAAGIFTKNRSASSSVLLDREHLADGRGQALVVISKNANVFTPTDRADAERICSQAAELLGIAKQDVMISCTGVIGVSLPMPTVEAGLQQAAAALQPGLQDNVAKAILTTDKGPKTCSAAFGEVRIAGMAKGAGMIEPNMATMLVYFFTNLDLPADKLQASLQRISDRTFNSISVDSDTSTSDSLILFSTGAVPYSDALYADFEAALAAMMSKLSREVVFGAEGANKLIEARVSKAGDEQQARQVAKFIINSPLVKTAVFGADPNWGRVVMALGKPGQTRDYPIDPKGVVIKMDGAVLFSGGAAVPLDLAGLSARMKARKKLDIEVELGEGDAAWTAWGCDLSYDYVKTNADYTS